MKMQKAVTHTENSAGERAECEGVLTEAAGEFSCWEPRPLHLETLSEDTDPRTRHAVVHRKNIPPEILEKLSHDMHSFIRVKVAEHKDTPEYLLRKLSSDTHGDITFAVARRTRDPEILECLAGSASSETRKAVAANEHTPLSTLIRLLRADEPDECIVCAVIRRTAFPVTQIMEELSKCENRAFAELVLAQFVYYRLDDYLDYFEGLEKAYHATDNPSEKHVWEQEMKRCTEFIEQHDLSGYFSIREEIAAMRNGQANERLCVRLRPHCIVLKPVEEHR